MSSTILDQAPTPYLYNPRIKASFSSAVQGKRLRVPILGLRLKEWFSSTTLRGLGCGASLGWKRDTSSCKRGWGKPMRFEVSSIYIVRQKGGEAQLIRTIVHTGISATTTYRVTRMVQQRHSFAGMSRTVFLFLIRLVFTDFVFFIKGDLWR